MEEAIRFHIEEMIAGNDPIPILQSRVQYVEIALPDSAA